MAEFLVDLGAGWFLDETGALLGDESATNDFSLPRFTAPGGQFDLDVSTWDGAAKTIAQALGAISGGKTGAELAALGFDEETSALLASATEVASLVSAVIPYVAAFAALLNVFSALSKNGDQRRTRLEAEMESYFHHLDNELKVTAEIEGGKERAAMLTDFGGALNTINDYAGDMRTEPNGDHSRRLNALIDLRFKVGDSQLPQYVLNATDVWNTMFDPADYSMSWMAVGTAGNRGKLMLHTDAGDKPATWPTTAAASFDHRRMLPTVAFAIQAYLALMRAVLPEFRSTQEFRTSVVKSAQGLSALARRIRDEWLALTRFEAGDYSLTWDYDDKDPMHDQRFYVGAADMRTHTAAYERWWNTKYPPDNRPVGGDKHEVWTIGTLHYDWAPSVATWVVEDGKLRITNPDACAAEANALSEKEYAKQLALSGYLHLTQLAALMRVQAAEPNQSETLTPPGEAKPQVEREQTGTHATKARSPLIIPVGTVEADATVVDQRIHATLTVKTQPTDPRERFVRYRVLLRTLSGSYENGHYRQPDYGFYFQTRYTPDTGDDTKGEDFVRLVTETNDAWLVDEIELVGERDGTPKRSDPPLEVKGSSGDRSNPDLTGVKVDCYELYVPDMLIDGGGKDEPNLEQAQKRWGEPKQVVFDYALDWQPPKAPAAAGELTVSLDADPGQSNFTVFLVIEEKFPWTGAVLHTAYPIAVDTAPTSVPSAFFSDEQAAIEQANEIMRDLYRRYSKLVHVKPGQKQEFILHEEDFKNTERLQQVFQSIRGQHPQLVHQVLSEHNLAVPMLKPG